MENSILKDAITEIAHMKERETVVREIGGHAYIIRNDGYEEIRPDCHPLPSTFRFNSLDGLVGIIKKEIDAITHAVTRALETPLFIEVESPRTVRVYSALDEYNRRAEVYRSELPNEIWRGSERWLSHESAIIALQSQFAPNEGTEYLLGFLSRITDENSVSSDDNGVTQTVQVRKGIALAAKEQVKPIVALKPYRTFLEVDQPESNFLVRVRKNSNDECEIGIIEADGGMWQLEAKKRIKSHLEWELRELKEDGRVVITM